MSRLRWNVFGLPMVFCFLLQANDKSSIQWSILSSRYNEDLDADFIPLLSQIHVVKHRRTSGLENNSAEVEGLAEILKSYLSHVQSNCAAVKHVFLDEALADQTHLLGSLQKILHEMGRLSHHLERCLSTCSESPPQESIRKVLSSPFEETDYDSRIARAVRTLRHSLKALEFFKTRLFSFQNESDRRYFSRILPEFFFWCCNNWY